jgi:hypothetical protein
MRHADRIDFLIRILPFAAWKDALLRGHVEHCAECGRWLAAADEARRAIVRAAELGDTSRLRLGVEARIADCEPALAPAASSLRSASALTPFWRWAAAAVGMFAAVLVTAALVLFFRSAAPSGALALETADADQFQITYVRIADEPAQTYIFKPHDSNIVIIWAGKTH